MEGRVTDRQTKRGLAGVQIYTVEREWTPTAVSGPDGKFTIYDLCATGMKLTARKGGYEIESHEYIVSAGSSVSIVMHVQTR